MKVQWKAVLIGVLSIFLSPLAFGPVQAAGEPSWADFDGNRIYYENYGQGDEAVVFVHCWTCDHTFWRHQIPAVAEGHRVIALDLPGHGKSDKPDVDYSQEYMARAIRAVLDQAGVTKAVMVGHSMGAASARMFTLQNPDRVKAFILVDGAIYELPEKPEDVEKWKAEFKAWSAPFEGPKGQKAAKAYIESFFVPATPPEARREILAITTATPMFVAVRALEGMGDPAIWKPVPITVPTLAIYAKATYMPEDYEMFIRKLFPNLEYHEWAGVGHFLMFDKPDELTKVIQEFLKKID